MRQLLLMRHAAAAPRTIDGTDFDRPLTEAGVESAERAGRSLRDNAPLPRVLLYSPAKRTTQTAELVAAQLGLERAVLHPEPKIYLATRTTLGKILAEAAGCHPCVLLIAHNPAVSELAHSLVPDSAVSMGTAEWRSIPMKSAEWSVLTT